MHSKFALTSLGSVVYIYNKCFLLTNLVLSPIQSIFLHAAFSEIRHISSQPLLQCHFTLLLHFFYFIFITHYEDNDGFMVYST